MYEVKRRLISVAVIAECMILVGSLSACGGGSTPATTSTTGSTTTGTTTGTTSTASTTGTTSTGTTTTGSTTTGTTTTGSTTTGTTTTGTTTSGSTTTGTTTTGTTVTGTGTGTGTASSSTTTSTDPLLAVYGTTYHVRTDGGTAVQCDGKTNAAYPGTGVAQACAWAHPFVALPPNGSSDAVRIKGGDTLVIHTGSYAIGFDASTQPYATGCSSAYSYDCYMKPIPSGASADRPTRIVGEGYGSSCPTSTKPVLWGTQAVYEMVNMNGSSNVTMACMEITDHGNCYNHPGAAACPSGAPFGTWANNGITIANSANIVLRDLDIHGLAGGGISSNVINNFTMTNVRIAANGYDGYSADGSNTGTMKFSGLMVEWNGCVETYPGKAITNCHSWYGDGLGAAGTAGDWIIEDSTFRYNVSDGLDLLYHNLGGKITLNRVKAEGNAGNQIKLNGNIVVTNSVIVGNCNFFYNKAFTESVGNCRALGDALAVSVAHAGESVYVLNNTIISEGNTVIYGGAGSQVPGTLTVTNNILIGHRFSIGAQTSADQVAADIYPEPSGNTWTLIDTYNIKENLRGGGTLCGKSGNICGASGLAGLVNQTAGSIDVNLTSTSPARNSGTSVGLNIPLLDLFNASRSSTVIDRGAVEMQ
jgi:hypothetical protein